MVADSSSEYQEILYELDAYLHKYPDSGPGRALRDKVITARKHAEAEEIPPPPLHSPTNKAVKQLPRSSLYKPLWIAVFIAVVIMGVYWVIARPVVPDLVGMQLDKAIYRLDIDNLKLGQTQKRIVKDTETDLVLEQFPSPGERVWFDNAISLVISVEPEPLPTLPFEPEMIAIKGGCFQMGSSQAEVDRYTDEKQHEVCNIQDFAIGKYEITFAEYDVFAEATGREKPDDGGWGRGRRPVINISWHDAIAYAEWLSQKTGKTYRLPTEAEWEYAARAGTTTTVDGRVNMGHMAEQISANLRSVYPV